MNELLEYALAHGADAPRIAAMSRDLVEDGLGWSWTPARVRRSITDPDTIVLVARRGATLGGFAILRCGDEEAHLDLLAVHPDWRRRGLGAELIRWLEKSARVAGIGVIHLEVRAGNRAARKFYHTLGFVEDDRLHGYYGGRESAIRMSRHLRVVPDLNSPG